MIGKRILVVEDEPLVADHIAEILENHDYEVVDIVDRIADARAVLEKNNVDMVLLDINLMGADNGVDLARELRLPFVYLTSYYDQKTLDRAKRTNPSGYIVKPFDEKDLLANVEIALSRKTRKQKEPEKLFLKNGNEIVSVMSSDIVFVEAFDNYATVYRDEDKFIISQTLKSIESRLGPYGFMRVHRSFLINFQHIDSISENYVFLKGKKVPVSKSFRKPLMDALSMI